MFLEVMDGDQSFIPIEWVKAVFRHLHTLTHAKASVCSIVGTQSTGKSTMLNVMLNLSFAVAAARCTKGIFMQVLKVSEEQYLVLLDTEGLRAPEILSS